jgi:hypothetical protein
MHKLLLCSLLLASMASAQRPVGDVEPLDRGVLADLLWQQHDVVSRCAHDNDVRAYIMTVSVRVSGRGNVSTLWDASIAVNAQSRPRDPDFERCVSGGIREALRNEPYDVGPRSFSARHTFQIGEGPQPSEPHEAAAYREDEVHSALRMNQYAMQQCLEAAGVPEQVTLRVSVRPDGSLVLMSADVPPGAGSRSMGCLASQVSTIRVQGHPSRTVTVVHHLPLTQH